jgi:hypothetical protein
LSSKQNANEVFTSFIDYPFYCFGAKLESPAKPFYLYSE